MNLFERLVAVCAVLTFVGFAIAGCVSESNKEKLVQSVGRERGDLAVRTSIAEPGPSKSH